MIEFLVFSHAKNQQGWWSINSLMDLSVWICFFTILHRILMKMSLHVGLITGLISDKQIDNCSTKIVVFARGFCCRYFLTIHIFVMDKCQIIIEMTQSYVQFAWVIDTIFICYIRLCNKNRIQKQNIKWLTHWNAQTHSKS